MSMFPNPSAHDITNMRAMTRDFAGSRDCGPYSALTIDMWKADREYGHFTIFGGREQHDKFARIAKAINEAFVEPELAQTAE